MSACTPACSATRGAASASGTSWPALAVEQAVPAARRVALHGRILADLAASGGDPARLAYHAEEAGQPAAVLEHATRALNAVGSAQWFATPTRRR